MPRKPPKLTAYRKYRLFSNKGFDLFLKVTGHDPIERALKVLGDKKGRTIVRRGLKAGAKIQEAELKRTTPFRTGNLQAAITSGSSRTRKGVIGANVEIAGATLKPSPEGSDGYYALFLETGTKTAKGKERIKPRRYFRLAYRDSAREALSVGQKLISQDIIKELERQAKKLSKMDMKGK